MRRYEPVVGRGRKGRLGGMKRIRALWVAVIMVAMLGVFAILAQAQPTDLFIVTEIQGEALFPEETFRCTDTTDPIKVATCSFVKRGSPGV